MKWKYSHLLLIPLVCAAIITVQPTSATTVAQLKRSLNQLVRQQNAQLGHYKSQLEAVASSELVSSVFSLSEVMHQCTIAWNILRTQYNAADATCASQGPHTPDSLARETEADLTQCLAEVEENFVEVTRPIDEGLSAKTTASSRLNFWLQSKLFETKRTASLAKVDTFDEAAASREIFNEAVLWDNVYSIRLYKSVRALPQLLFNAGEYSFICGLNSFNKFFQKLKNTEGYLNTNCAGKRDDNGGVNGADVASGPVLAGDQVYVNKTSVGVKSSSPEAVVVLVVE